MGKSCAMGARQRIVVTNGPRFVHISASFDTTLGWPYLAMSMSAVSLCFIDQEPATVLADVPVATTSPEETSTCRLHAPSARPASVTIMVVLQARERITTSWIGMPELLRVIG